MPLRPRPPHAGTERAIATRTIYRAGAEHVTESGQQVEALSAEGTRAEKQAPCDTHHAGRMIDQQLNQRDAPQTARDVTEPTRSSKVRPDVS